MTIPLLAQLGARAIQGLIPGSQPAAARSSGSADFARLLSQARAGQLASGREVTIARGAGVKLTDDQIKRLSVAADMAEAQGATRALVHIDGKTLRLDVAMREITGSADLKSATVLTGIDAVIDVPGDTPQTEHPPALQPSIHNASLLSALSRKPTQT